MTQFRRKTDGAVVTAEKSRPSKLAEQSQDLGIPLGPGDWIVTASDGTRYAVARDSFCREYEVL